MKKIFHFVSTNVLSGLENVVINICTLVKGCNFTYVSPNGPINKYLKKYNIKHVSIKKITPLNVRKVIKKYKPDIVQGHDVKASLALAFNSRLCHKNNIKIISELHNDDPRMWRYSLRSIIYALSVPYYDKIVMISQAIKDHYIFKSLIKKKSIVINNVVNTYRINLMKNKYRKKWDCIFLGRLVNQKNPIKFINIIYSLKHYDKNIRAAIVGNGYLYDKSWEYINQLGMSKNIQMLGFQSNPFLYLKESKILLMPSKYEGFGLVALESLLVGTPVICSYTGGLVNIISSSCGGFARSERAYVKKIISLLSNKKLYDLKSINCYKQFNSIDNMRDFKRGYSELYS